MDRERPHRARFAANKKQQQRPKSVTYASMSSLLLLLSLSTLVKVSAATVASPVEYEDGLILKQVHVVTRHGSRHALPKGADGLTKDQEMDENSYLTAFGRKQMYDLGEWMQATYYSKNQDAMISFESSPYDRTISSANSLALGLLNITTSKTFTNTTVPKEIFTGLPPVMMSEADNDIYIRAYDKCPAFTSKLNTLYTSAQWMQLQEDSMPLLQNLATIEEFKQYAKSGEGFIPLTEIWNVFDAVHVAKTECAASATLGMEYFINELVPLQKEGMTCGEAIEDWISTEDWQELVQVAHTVELLKYNGGPHQKDPAANTEVIVWGQQPYCS
jgi:Histidine phosphatase superfamily (branch 2)